MLATASIACCAQPPRPVIDSAYVAVERAYFPQLSPDTSHVAYSTVDGLWLILRDRATGSDLVVDSVGAPGYDARFGGDGRLYYVTMERRKNNLVYRTAHSFNPADSSHRVELEAQHGAVRLCPTASGMAIEGEHKSRVIGDKRDKWVYTVGSKLVIMNGGHKTEVSPAGKCAGYIWASLSPDGKRVVFDAVGKGLYVCDLNGKVQARLGNYLMPAWLDNDHVVAMLSSANNRTVKKQQLVALPADGSGDVIELTQPDEDASYPMSRGDGRVAYSGRHSEGCVALMANAECELRNAKSEVSRQTHDIPAISGLDTGKISPRVFVNPGHGGHDNNDRPCPFLNDAAGATVQYYESESNLEKGKALCEILSHKGYRVITSRVDNTTADDLPLFEIVALAANSGADAFVSLHSNATGVAKRMNFPLALYRGYTGEPKSEGSDQIAKAVLKYAGANQLAPWSATERAAGDYSFYNWGYGVGLGVLRYNKLPAMLIEGTFHDYVPERCRLLNPDYCWHEAWVVSKGLDDYFSRPDKSGKGLVAGVIADSQAKRSYKGQLFGRDSYRPVSGVEVVLSDKHGHRVASYKTDMRDNGVFIFRNLKPGTYHLDVPSRPLDEPIEVEVKAGRDTYADIIY